jgi:hypothetical protein
MRKSILIICTVVLIFCLWLLLHQNDQQVKTISSEVQAALTNQPSANQVPATPAQTTQNPSTPKPSSASLAEAEAKYRATPEGSNAFQQRIQAEWQKPIEFYGKVIDENSNPVAGVSIQFRWSGFSDEVFTAATESDSEGLFSLQGKQGRVLDVSASKEGYYNSQKDKTGFLYSLGPDIYSPDSLNPIVFHLRKKRRGESLIEKDFPPGIGQIWQLHHDGTPIELDLLNGSQNVAGSGQLKLEFWRDISNLHKQPFDWKLQLSIPNGGLVPTDDEFAFQAPESGYLPSIVIDMPATNQNWLGEIRSKYYIQLPNGKYGRIDFYLLPYNGVFEVQSAINPFGSLNLEPSK